MFLLKNQKETLKCFYNYDWLNVTLSNLYRH